MTAQAHRINIEAGQQSVFDALSTADGWSRWFTPEVTGDFTDGSEIVCRPNGRAPIRLRVTSVKPGSAIAFEALEGPFAAPGATTSIELASADNSRTTVSLRHDTPLIPEEDLAACNTYWGILLGQLRAYCQTRNAATLL
jgi:uncharacterized protein YndB with AHSA1/START domain